MQDIQLWTMIGGAIMATAAAIFGGLNLVSGLTEDKVQAGIAPITARLDGMETRFGERFDLMDKKLDLVIDTMNRRFEQVDKRLEQVDARLDRVDARLDRVEMQRTEPPIDRRP